MEFGQKRFHLTRTAKALLGVLLAVVLLCGMLPLAGMAEKGGITAVELKCEGAVNPHGIDNTAPLFSWKLTSSLQSQYQSAYRILVADSPEALEADSGNMWDSGKVESDRQLDVEYAGKALEAKADYYWKVMVWSKDGQASDWSETASFDMGMLSDSDWGDAVWIGEGEESSGTDSIVNYDVTMDFQAVQQADGKFCNFEPLIAVKNNGADFIVCQLQLKSADANDPQFRPHRAVGYGWAEVAAVAMNHEALTPDNVYEPHTLRLEVRDKTVTVYVDGVQESAYTFNLTAPIGYGGLGFRMVSDGGTYRDEYFVDNIKTVNADTGETLFSEDFESGNYFAGGTVEDGRLHLKGGVDSDPVLQKNTDAGVYTVEYDFKIDSNSSGFLFDMQEANSFYMWQVNLDVQPGKAIFRPHKCVGGSFSVMKEADVTDVMSAGTGMNGLHSMKIEVSGTEIKTYIDGTLIDTMTDAAILPLGGVGLRNVESADDHQVTWYDNIVVRDDTGHVLFSEDFENPNKVQFNGGQVIDGMYKMTGNQTVSSLDDDDRPATMLRKEFQLTKEVKRASLYVTSLGIYEMFINGEKVGDDYLNPGWTEYNIFGSDEPGRLFYQAYDVTHMLKTGENAIAGLLGHGWYSGKVNAYGTGPDQSGTYGSKDYLKAQLLLEYEDGSETIVTDDSWTSCVEGQFRYNDLENGETYDATREIPGWNDADCNGGVWMPVEAKADAYTGRVMAQVGPTVKKYGELKPISVTQKDGKYIFDLGQNMVGWARFQNLTGTAGQTLVLKFGEVLDEDGNVFTGNLRSARATDTYIMKGGEPETWEPRFTQHGFRYVELSGYTGPELTADNLRGVVISSLSEITGSIETSEENVNQLFSNIMWSEIGNFISIPLGCPQRDERLGWTGDLQLFTGTAAYNADVQEFLRNWLGDLRDAQGDTGYYTDIAPRIWLTGEGAGGWADAGVVIPYLMYERYNDLRTVEESWESMTKFMDYLYNTYGSKGYIRTSVRYGDHLNNNASTPYELIGTAYYAYDADLMAVMAEALGKTEDAAKYRELSEKIKKAFTAKFVHEDGSITFTGSADGKHYVFADGSQSQEEQIASSRKTYETQTSYLLALHMDMLPDELRAPAAAFLVENIKKLDYHLSTGYMGVSLINDVLTEAGYADVAYKLLLQDTYPSWLYSVVNGATTTWERWDSYTADKGFGDLAMNSFNHYAPGSVGNWMYQYMAGISSSKEVGKTGFKELNIKPYVDTQMSFVNASFETRYGDVESSWKIVGENGVEMAVTVPVNTTANVYVPCGGDAGGVAAPSGAVFLKMDGNFAVYQVGSGSYTFKADAIAEETTAPTTTEPTQPTPPERVEYTYDFNDASELNDFIPYFEAVSGSSVEEDSYTDHWVLRDGKLVRTNLETGKDPSTGNNNAMLYLDDEPFQYFEAEFSFYHGDSWGWAQFGFGSQIPGASTVEAGCAGLFMSREGDVYLPIPEDDLYQVKAGPYTEDFVKENHHTLKINVVKGQADNQLKINVYAKENDGEYVQVVQDYILTDADIAAGGYIFLQAQNDSVSYDFLHIKRLNADGSDMVARPSTPTTTEPSSDVTDAPTSGSSAETTQEPGTQTTTSGDTNPPSTGVTMALTSVVLLAGSAAALVLTKKRRS